MKLCTMITAILLLLCSSPMALAQTDHEEDRAVLRHLKDDYEKAVADGNADLLAPYIAEDFSGVVATNEQITGFQGLKEYWKKVQDIIGQGGKVKTSVSFEPSLIAGDFAISRGKTDNVITTSTGKSFTYVSHWTAVSRKQDGLWKLIRIHDSMDPINNEFVAMFSKYQSIKYAAMVGVACLVVGIVVGRATKRKAIAS